MMRTISLDFGIAVQKTSKESLLMSFELQAEKLSRYANILQGWQAANHVQNDWI